MFMRFNHSRTCGEIPHGTTFNCTVHPERNWRSQNERQSSRGTPPLLRVALKKQGILTMTGRRAVQIPRSACTTTRGQEVLRLCECFASRNTHSAQDDIFRMTFCRYSWPPELRAVDLFVSIFQVQDRRTELISSLPQSGWLQLLDPDLSNPVPVHLFYRVAMSVMLETVTRPRDSL